MIDFDRWFARQTPSPPPPEPELPDGVWESGPGVFKARCCRCGNDYELVYDPMEFTEEGNYCGGGYLCVP